MRLPTLHGGAILLLHSVTPSWRNVRSVCWDAFAPDTLATAESAADKSPRINIRDAISAAERRLNGTHNGHPTKTQYLATSNGHLALVHAIQIENDDLGTSYEAFVDAHSGQLLSLTDFVCDASVSCPYNLPANELTLVNSTQFFLLQVEPRLPTNFKY